MLGYQLLTHTSIFSLLYSTKIRLANTRRWANGEGLAQVLSKEADGYGTNPPAFALARDPNCVGLAVLVLSPLPPSATGSSSAPTSRYDLIANAICFEVLSPVDLKAFVFSDLGCMADLLLRDLQHPQFLCARGS